MKDVPINNIKELYCHYFKFQDSKIKNTGWVVVKCCFHDDRHPSLGINVINGGFKCFSCGKKGGLFHFLVNKGYTKKTAYQLVKQLLYKKKI